MIASPCNKVCVINEATGLCRGCHRTLDEIARWGAMSEAERVEVVEKLAERAARAGEAEASNTGAGR